MVSSVWEVVKVKTHSSCLTLLLAVFKVPLVRHLPIQVLRHHNFCHGKGWDSAKLFLRKRRRSRNIRPELAKFMVTALLVGSYPDRVSPQHSRIAASILGAFASTEY